jgi:hypothetical protein
VRRPALLGAALALAGCELGGGADDGQGSSAPRATTRVEVVDGIVIVIVELADGNRVQARVLGHDPNAAGLQRCPCSVRGTVEECAARALDMVNVPAVGETLGRRGNEHVRAAFLTPPPSARLLEELAREVLS